VDEAVVSGSDEGEFALHLTLSFDDEDSPEEDHAGRERCATFEVRVRDCATSARLFPRFARSPRARA
jgi:hypothetical protein